MSETRTETVPLVDGSALRLTVAEPVGPVRGGIVVLHEARGMTAAARGMVEGLAAEGWLTVVSCGSPGVAAGLSSKPTRATSSASSASEAPRHPRSS